MNETKSLPRSPQLLRGSPPVSWIPQPDEFSSLSKSQSVVCEIVSINGKNLTDVYLASK